MKQEDINTVMRKMKTVFCVKTLNALGKSIGFSQRERIITPGRLALSLIKAFSCNKIETIADAQRCFNEMFNEKIAYKPFHNQVAKKTFSELMRQIASSVLEHTVVQVLEFNKNSLLEKFESIYLQDGTSFGLKKSLCKRFPGRFRTVSPAAVELHVTYELPYESPTKITLTADKESERAELPRPEELENSLLLADAGYLSALYLSQLQSSNASYLMRASTKINPIVVNNGESIINKKTAKTLKDSKKHFSKSKTYDLDVIFRDDSTNAQHRLIVIWNKKKKAYVYLITNLSRQEYTAEQIREIYRLRWQIELVFKEWKSYANLHKFDTSNESIAEGFIWCAIIAALIKTFIAHATQIIKKVEVSTRKVAMCSAGVLSRIFEALAIGSLYRLKSEIIKTIEFLSNNALRSHPKRDRNKGRLKIGVEPVFSFLKN